MHIKTKIPPPLVALTFGFLINYTKDIFPKIEIRNGIIFGSFMIIIGLIIILSAIILFKKYQTTITPLNPSNATKLITDGVYKFSRNPMYLGLLILQIGLGMLLSVIHITFFSLFTYVVLKYYVIIPEEKYLEEKFGEKYLNYKISVRRWF